VGRRTFATAAAAAGRGLSAGERALGADRMSEAPPVTLRNQTGGCATALERR